MSKYDENGSPYDTADENRENGSSYNGTRQVLGQSESMSSTEDFLPHAENDKVARVEENAIGMAKEAVSGRMRKRLSIRLVCSLFVLVLAIIASLLWVDGRHEGSHLVPT